MNESIKDGDMSRPCDEWAEKLAVMREDMFSPAEREGLYAHVQTCSACKEKLVQYRVVDEALYRLFAAEPLTETPSVLSASRGCAVSRSRRRFPHLPSSVSFATIQPIDISLSVGLLTFVIGWSIARVSNINTAFVTPLATVVTVVIFALVMGTRTQSLLALIGIPSHEEELGSAVGWSNSPTADVSLDKREDALPLAVERQEASLPIEDREAVRLSERRHSREKGQRDKRVLVAVMLSLLAVSAASFGVTLLNPVKPSQAEMTSLAGTPTGISSDGSRVFDINRPDRTLKNQAAREVAKGNMQGAEVLWNQALAVDSTDAEVLIYQENQRVLASQRPYITFVVGVTLAPEDVGSGRGSLQGAYVAQKEFNMHAQVSGGMQLRLLIAASGFNDADSREVAQQVVQAAQKDRTIVGVMGWPDSASTLGAMKVFAAAHLPMVSPSASSVDLTGISPYFFRIAPPDSVQGAVAAQYAKQTLHAKRVVLFYDPQDPYSRSLADAFSSNFLLNAGGTVMSELYTVGDQQTISEIIQNALAQHPDLIYFAGYVHDASVVLQNLPACEPVPGNCLLVMGGDAFYTEEDYSSEASKSYSRLRFTAFAFPDEWRIQGLQERPQFFNEYAQDFDPHKQYQTDKYGYEPADGNAILAYDAMQALLHASAMLLEGGKASFTAADLQQALTQIFGSHALTGVSGTIAFGPDGNPINKQVLVLAGGANGQTSLVSIENASQ
ncbi:MAG: ABC transporter substrate-binding protein [Ktedonobacteraceae bacterium]|nr:ABC transporter substrate-binding protein [Ktedonobacteraceae bacterium]